MEEWEREEEKGKKEVERMRDGKRTVQQVEQIKRKEEKGK